MSRAGGAYRKDMQRVNDQAVVAGQGCLNTGRRFIVPARLMACLRAESKQRARHLLEAALGWRLVIRASASRWQCGGSGRLGPLM
jgi:hypothetical protein